MSWFTDFEQNLVDELSPAAHRLLAAILEFAADRDDEPSETEINKEAVLSSLESREGKRLENAALRQRLLKVNRALSEEPFLADGLPLLQIRSTKFHFRLDWTEEALELIRKRRARETFSSAAHSDRLETTGVSVPPEFRKPTYQVFVSHAHESDDVERIVDAFVDLLTHKLSHLPDRWRNKFNVELWFDRRRVHNRSLDFEKQTDRACSDSALCVFLMNAKWCDSPACRREARVFLEREASSGDGPYVSILLNGKREYLAEDFRSMPLLPETWRGPNRTTYKSLIELWDNDRTSIQDAFVDNVRDQICEYLENNGGPDIGPHVSESATETRVVKLRTAIAQSPIAATDVEARHRVEGVFVEGEGDDFRTREERGIPAVETLYDWASKDGDERHVILLGGFGMGKTTTVQLLAERLHNELKQGKKVPTPIYLDFRRLIPLSAYGEPVRAELADLIRTALHPDASRDIEGEDVIRLIRGDNCVVIFDGLDEVGNRTGREAAAQLYRQFLEIVPSKIRANERKEGVPDWTGCGVRTILTCRTHFFRSMREQTSFTEGSHRSVTGRQDRSKGDSGKPSARTYHMAPLRLEQIEELFGRVLGEKDGGRAFELIRTIHDLPGLAARPIMARFISEITDSLMFRHEAGDEINIATVYQELFELGLERDAEKRPLLKPHDRADVLRALAAHLHCEGLGPQKADDLERWFDGFAREHPGIMLVVSSGRVNTRDLLHTELENASFLVRDSDDRFRFAHTSYFEYFLASALISVVADPERLRDFAKRSMSRETRNFLRAIADRDARREALDATLTAILQSDAGLEERRFCLDVLCEGAVDQVPGGANLAGFDLRDLRIGPTHSVWNGIDFQGAQLNALDARNVVFEGCNFAGTILANAGFENCRFENCTGIPKGLGSARGVKTSLPPDWHEHTRHRGRYWKPASISEVSSIVVASSLRSVAFSPDGSRVLTGSGDGSARLWDTASGEKLHEFSGHEGSVSSVAFDPDGSRVLTGSWDRSARLWDAVSGEELRRLSGHEGSVESVAFSPDGSRVLTGSGDGSARLWDAASGEELRRFSGHENWVVSVAFGPDGSRVLTGSEDASVRLWDAASGEELRRLSGHEGSVESVAFSPDGSRVLTGSRDHSARLWDVASGEELRRFNGHEGSVSSVAFGPDGSQVLSGSADRSARLWGTESGEELRRFSGHENWVESVAFSPDGSRVLTGSRDRSARLWDAANGEELCRFSGYEDWVVSVAFGPDGSQVLTGSWDGGARLWDAASGEELRRFSGHGGWVESVAFSPDGSLVLTGTWDDCARLWDAASGEELRRFIGHEDWVESVAFGPDGSRVLTGGADRSARLWDAANGKELRRFNGHESWVLCVVFGPDGSRVLTGGGDGSARLWDAASGEELRRFSGHEGSVESAVFSPDGSRVLTGSEDRSARLWDAASGEELRRFSGHEGSVESVAFSPDGSQVLTGSGDRSARLWDAVSGEELRRLSGHKGSVESVAFGPDGTRVLTGSQDSSARLWDAASGKELWRVLALPEAWVKLAADGTVIDGGGDLWRYVN